MPQKEYDESHWHYVQAADEVFVGRKHFFDDDVRYLLGKWLSLERLSLKIVEMGSGGGYFTEQLLKMANNPHLICVEPDNVLLDYAKKRLGDKVVFNKGFAEDPPLPDNTADLVICHFLLNIVPDIKAVVAGMTKVARSGGIVCVIEPFLGDFHTSDPRAKIIVDGFAASHKGAWKLRRQLIDYTKYSRDKHLYPKIYSECGLGNIEVRAIGMSHYSGDRRWTREDVVQDARDNLNLLEKHRGRYKTNMMRFGWKEDKIEEFFRTWREYHMDRIKNPEKDFVDHNLEVGCVLVIIGQKK